MHAHITHNRTQKYHKINLLKYLIWYLLTIIISLYSNYWHFKSTIQVMSHVETSWNFDFCPFRLWLSHRLRWQQVLSLQWLRSVGRSAENQQARDPGILRWCIAIWWYFGFWSPFWRFQKYSGALKLNLIWALLTETVDSSTYSRMFCSDWLILQPKIEDKASAEFSRKSAPAELVPFPDWTEVAWLLIMVFQTSMNWEWKELFEWLENKNNNIEEY